MSASKRIGYIDAMRGFTMILVVFSHVIMFTFQSEPSFSLNSIFMTFRMPLFFFLSGFLMYKPGRFSNNICQFIKQKFIVQIIPTIIFSAIYALIFKWSLGGLWSETAKCGFWFTYTLFFYFLIYSIGDWFLSKFVSGRIKLIIGCLGACFIYGIAKYSLLPSCPWAALRVNGLLGLANFQYFIFFFFGAYIRKHFELLSRRFDNKYFMTILIAGFVLLQILLQVPTLQETLISYNFALYSVIKSISGFFGILVVFAFFRRYSDSFDRNKPMGYALQYIGERTLDIYLLHLFFIQGDLSSIGRFLTENCNPVLELFIGLIVALAIIIICLILSNILRCSDTLAKVLFGKVIPSNVQR